MKNTTSPQHAFFPAVTGTARDINQARLRLPETPLRLFDVSDCRRRSSVPRAARDVPAASRSQLLQEDTVALFGVKQLS